jgi:hypothetical protein
MEGFFEIQDIFFAWRLFVLRGSSFTGVSYEASQLMVRSQVTAEGDLVLVLR